MGSRPVSAEIMAELSKYVLAFDVGQEKLFNDNFSQRKWHKICKNAGLKDLKLHVTQRLLEHSSPNLTNKVYTNVDPVLRQSVDQLPIEQWLQK
jgi:hypothetical protein